MTANDMSTLKDLYLSLDEDPDMKKADYVLQTLWRDHSTNLDIVGPYFTSSGKGIYVRAIYNIITYFTLYTGTFTARFMPACLMNTCNNSTPLASESVL